LPPDPLVLAFDTSAAHCAAALLCGDTLLADGFEEMRKGQAERLFPMLEEILAKGGATWADLGLIGVGVGPGNFTGIRIAVSAARGLSLSLGIKAVGVSALEAQARPHPRPLLSLVPAHAGQAYAARLTDTGMEPPVLMPLAQAVDEAARDGLAICDAPGLLAEHAEVISPTLATDRPPQQEPPRLAPAPLAPAIGRLALQRAPDAPARPSPLYIRPADAAPSRDAPPVILA